MFTQSFYTYLFDDYFHANWMNLASQACTYSPMLVMMFLLPSMARRSVNCGAPIFIVEKSADMRYDKLLNLSGVTGDYSDSRFRERNAYEKWKKT